MTEIDIVEYKLSLYYMMVGEKAGDSEIVYVHSGNTSFENNVGKLRGMW